MALISEYLSRRSVQEAASISGAEAYAVVAGESDPDPAKAYQIREAIDTAAETLDDETALLCVEMFPTWEVGKWYEGPDDETTASRVRRNDRLYKCQQGHTSQADWAPELAPALWVEIAEEGSGESIDDPIAYNNNMELEEGKYYSQDGVVYYCWRSTEIAVYNDLKDLVNLYVRVAE